MSYKKYRGPVETIEHAMMAHMVVTVKCTRCPQWTNMWAWKLYERLKMKGNQSSPLRKPLDGFYCRGCHRRVQAIVSPGMR